jgi:hypothetical protein
MSQLAVHLATAMIVGVGFGALGFEEVARAAQAFVPGRAQPQSPGGPASRLIDAGRSGLGRARQDVSSMRLAGRSLSRRRAR